MGFDITFHPVKQRQEGEAFRALLGKTLTPAEIVAPLNITDQESREIVEENLGQVLQALEDKEDYLSSIISYFMGMYSSYLRTYWYARGSALTFLAEEHEAKDEVRAFFRPVVAWIGGPVEGIEDPSEGLINGNYSGAGIVEDVAGLKRWIESHNLHPIFDEEGIDSLTRCMNYCIEHDCHLLEVSDVFSPMAGSCSCQENVRAHFLENIEKP